MIRTLLFDLDGTLLPMDMDKFLSGYIKSIAARVAHLVPPDVFGRQLLASTAKMVGNEDPGLTNEEVFDHDFYPRLGLDKSVAKPIFEDFYFTEFNKLQALTVPSPAAREAVLAAAERGYRLVLATNPVFPRIAIDARLRWANLADLPWELVTCYEEMHFCKPNPRYFQEILDRTGARAQECLMVGNDAEEDLVAGELGMKTYLTTECLINRSGLEPRADWVGTLRELRDLLTAGFAA